MHLLNDRKEKACPNLSVASQWHISHWILSLNSYCMSCML